MFKNFVILLSLHFISITIVTIDFVFFNHCVNKTFQYILLLIDLKKLFNSGFIFAIFIKLKFNNVFDFVKYDKQIFMFNSNSQPAVIFNVLVYCIIISRVF